MLINMRNGLMAGGGLSAKSYVQDGLIAMWDGIENAGWGVHDPNATVWKDLMDSSRWYELNEYAEWGDSYITKADHSYAGWVGRINNPIPRTTNYQKECVVLKHKTFGDRAVFWSVDPNDTANKQNELCELAVNTWALSGLPVSKPYINIADEVVSISGYGTSSIYKNAVLSTKMYDNNVSYGRGSLLGGNNAATGYKSKYGTDGNIYNIRIYSRALTADEIAHNYAVDKARFGLPDAT